MRTREKEKSLSVLIKELDDVVSEYVRINAADATGTITCISCDARVWWRDSDCAHFVDRRNMATRFLTLNLAAACQDCNRFNEDEHKKAWARKLGAAKVLALETMGRSLMKHTRFEIEQLTEVFKAKVSLLRKAKHL